jgi:hypothetical protein
MMDCRNGDRCSLDIDTSADQLLDGTKSAAAEFLRDRIGARGIFVDNADQFNGFQFVGKLMVDAGMIASEGAYADDSNGNGV